MSTKFQLDWTACPSRIVGPLVVVSFLYCSRRERQKDKFNTRLIFNRLNCIKYKSVTKILNCIILYITLCSLLYQTNEEVRENQIINVNVLMGSCQNLHGLFSHFLSQICRAVYTNFSCLKSLERFNMFQLFICL